MVANNIATKVMIITGKRNLNEKTIPDIKAYNIKSNIANIIAIYLSIHYPTISNIANEI